MVAPDDDEISRTSNCAIRWLQWSPFRGSPSLAAAKGNDSKISYGLNLRKTTEWNETEGDDQASCSKSKPPGTEVTRSAPGKDVLLQKLKSDLRRLPDDQGMEEFADGPVEAFAVALLAGYGWYLGRGIGKNAKEDVKVLERQKWTRRHGIGFVRIVGGRDAEGEDSRRGSQSSMGQISWLTSHIRVRIISKDLKGGRLYLKKGVVVDVEDRFLYCLVNIKGSLGVLWSGIWTEKLVLFKMQILTPCLMSALNKLQSTLGIQATLVIDSCAAVSLEKQFCPLDQYVFRTMILLLSHTS
ncbi:LOW QUALITY PROTEIN: Spp2/MOS2, G-patch domain containing protein [Trema orientale]|uniref:Spp2/MOS2, G-patch domain containing protein n=1 Tax=Trema orientale TaxID=63057 RepID=A0A2P5FZI2_TREOI|nr:LOW QUALITY PROTEIN: Spp2/MOS2, G-patch domain containing protein [Trema orientale]